MIMFLENRNKSTVYFFIFQIVFALICLSSEKNVGSSTLATQHRLNKRQTVDNCATNQFSCKNGGECINIFFVCDAASDCADSSDETADVCKNKVCPASSFKCRYGACINSRHKCDGVKHCPDGSDEFQEVCQKLSKFSLDTPLISDNVPGSCTLPTHVSDKKFTVFCPENQKCSKESGKKVPKYTEVTLQCLSGYAYENEDLRSYCSNGTWIPQIKNCSKICKKLKPKNVDLTCVYKNVTVDCERDLLAGTVVSPRCKPHHHEEFPPNYRDITCDSDGEWSNQLFVCVPDCGKLLINDIPMIFKGQTVKYGEAPWHVAIYSLQEKDPLLICGGTIISPQLIVSAAHCFYDDNNLKAYKETDFEVAVSKLVRDYKVQDNSQTKKYRIRQIFFPSKGFFGLLTNYAADIALLWLAEKIAISRTVLPACIQWSHHSFEPPEGTLGKVAGWGRTEEEEQSEILRTAELPYISYKKCIEITNNDLKDTITEKKFCAGSTNGPTVLRGDSGGGILFKDQFTGMYYLRGIVSVRAATTNTSIAIFTDIGEYMNWINFIREKVENEIPKERT